MKRMIDTIKVLVFSALLISSVVGALTVRDFITPPERIVEVPREIEVPERPRSVDELVAEIAPRFEVSPLVVAAIIDQESNGERSAIRYEPGQVKRAQKITRNEQQQRMYASSHGVMQIMGWWAPEFKLEWSDLYDTRTNIELGCAILRRGLDRHQGKPKYARLRAALGEYNGSLEYADAVLARIGRKLIEERL